jgi:glycosyltransferase involved in cell wall biosynthesis
MNVSALVLTLNEEINLPNCLESLSWCDDIVVLDSYSTDRTEEVARSAGARFIQRKFDNYATHRNFGLNEIEYKHLWVLMLDADEVIPPELREEIQNIIKIADDETCLYLVRRKDFFMGSWIRRSCGYPTWAARLLKVGRVSIEREINEEYHTDGKVGFLKEHFLHYSFNKGFHAWFEKHNRYSTMEAELLAENASTEINWRDIFISDPVLRRKAIKSFVYKLPGRPFLVFLALYIIRGGFLEGRAGLTFCLLRSFYEFMINCKMREIRLRKMELPL